MNEHVKLPSGPPPDAAKAIAEYFSRVRAALPARARGECEEAIEDLRTHVIERLGETAGVSADLARILAELGSPEDLAAGLAESVEKEKRSPLSGSVLGVPYELRPPTAERIASRWWNPLDPRLFMPRLFGIGWTVNFASIAVRLGLVRPDDEDVPFALVPGRRLAVALALPLALAAGLAILAAVCQPSLPAFLADRYAIAGKAGRLTPKWAALALPVCMTVLGAGLAGWTWIRRRPPLSRVAAGALGTALASISIGGYGYYAAVALGGPAVAILIAGIAGALLLPFALFVILSRIGRAAEQKRDLESTGDEGGSK